MRRIKQLPAHGAPSREGTPTRVLSPVRPPPCGSSPSSTIEKAAHPFHRQHPPVAAEFRQFTIGRNSLRAEILLMRCFRFTRGRIFLLEINPAIATGVMPKWRSVLAFCGGHPPRRSVWGFLVCHGHSWLSFRVPGLAYVTPGVIYARIAHCQGCQRGTSRNYWMTSTI